MKMTRWLLTCTYAVANNESMHSLSAWLDQERGRQIRLAQFLGLKPPVVAAWASGRRPVPISHAAEIERFTGGAVTRRELFPKDWGRIWPELVATPAAIDTNAAQSAEQGAV